MTKTQMNCEWPRLSVRTQTYRQSLTSLPEDSDQEKKRARLPWQFVFFKEARPSDWCEGLFSSLLVLVPASPERRAEPFIVDSLDASFCFQLLDFPAILADRIPEAASTNLFLFLFIISSFTLFPSFSSPPLFLPFRLNLPHPCNPLFLSLLLRSSWKLDFPQRSGVTRIESESYLLMEKFPRMK